MITAVKKAAILGVALLFLDIAGEKVACAASESVLELKVKADQLMKGRNIERAIPLYEQVLRKDREFANAYYNLAVAHYLQGNLKKAADNLTHFVRLRPEDPEGHYNLACLKLRFGAFEEAEELFLKAKQCPSCPKSLSERIKKALHYVKDLRNEPARTQELLAYLLSGTLPTPTAS